MKLTILLLISVLSLHASASTAQKAVCNGMYNSQTLHAEFAATNEETAQGSITQDISVLLKTEMSCTEECSLLRKLVVHITNSSVTATAAITYLPMIKNSNDTQLWFPSVDSTINGQVLNLECVIVPKNL